jgi:hypothetical protein
MNGTLIQILFGWPAIIVCILLSAAGVWWKKPGLLITSGILCLPFTYYLSGMHILPGLLLPVCLFGAAYAIKRRWNIAAWLLITPLVLIAVSLAYKVLTQ